MAADVVPVLKEAIETQFQNGVMRDLRAMRISKRIRDGTATLSDAHEYSQALGESLSKALTNTLTAENLPNGTLYYNIAQRTVVPELEKTHQLVNEIARDIQEITDKKAGIGLKSVTAKFPKLRISDLIDKMTEDGISLEDAVKWLGEPIVNNAEAFYDDYVEENARFRNSAGMKTTITRVAAHGCCPWCDAKAGTFNYDEAPDDIYQRHENCRCTVTFQSGKRSQDVWSKRTWQSTAEELLRRKDAGSVPTMTPQERINQIRQLARDEIISEYESQTGYSRRTAAASTRNKSPAQVAADIQKIQERRRQTRR